MYWKTIEKAFRGIDIEDVSSLNSDDNLELIRRTYEQIVELETIYGPFSFDEYKRNAGRYPSGSQLLPTDDAATSEEVIFPTEVATVNMVYPAPSTSTCPDFPVPPEVLAGECFLCDTCVRCSKALFSACKSYPSYDDMPACSLTSGEMGSASSADIEAATPCVLYDTVDEDELPADTTYITLGQTTGSSVRAREERGGVSEAARHPLPYYSNPPSHSLARSARSTATAPGWGLRRSTV
jgi:hypothetical protein